MTHGARQYAEEALRRYGYHSQSYHILSDDKSYFLSSRGIEGVIAYVVIARVALAAGDPVCSPENIADFAEEFRLFCKQRKWKCCFQAVTDRCETALSRIGFGSLKIGEEPFFDLTKLSWAGGAFRDLRRDVRRARKHGLSVAEYRPSEGRRDDWEAQMEALSAAWAKLKGSGEFSFLIGGPSLAAPGSRRYFLALMGEAVEAFVVCTPIHARNGVYFDLMRRKEDPVPGTALLLISEAMQMLRDQGYALATLGTAPLANEHVDDPDQSRIVELAMEFAFNHLGHFHRNKPLYQFKEQFGPSWWEARYLAYWPRRFNPIVLYALLKAYDPTGVTGQVRRQIQLAWRGIKWLGQIPREVLEKLLPR